MFDLSEYRRRPELLSDHLPWAAMVAPGVVLNKDGSLQTSFRFRGPDLDSATPSELQQVAARMNNVLRRFGSGWALFFETERRPALAYPLSEFDHAAAWLVDAERRSAFQRSMPLRERGAGAAAQHHESRHYLTLAWLPPPDPQSWWRRLLLLGPAGMTPNGRFELVQFAQEVARAADQLRSLLPEFAALDDAETLAYLHGRVGATSHPIRPPDPPALLDAVLGDATLTTGLAPQLGTAHLRLLTIKGFPDLTHPAMLDALDRLQFPYRWVTRFIALDKTVAVGELTRLRRQWFAKRKSLFAVLREVLYNQPAPLLDSDADNKCLDADAALQEAGADQVSFGYLTTTLVLQHDDAQIAEARLRAIEKVIQSSGFAAIAESLNAVEAWLGSLPGHLYANVRQPLVHSLNLAHMAPLSGQWAGPEGNAHLKAPPLLQASSQGTTPFRLSTHLGDVGHMMVVGPTGAGKSVLLAVMALQFLRYAGARIVAFDKGGSLKAVTLALQGQHYRLDLEEACGSGQATVFQPLRDIDQAGPCAFAFSWLQALLAMEGVSWTPQLTDHLWQALANLRSAPVQQRTLTGLALLLQSQPLKAALLPYTLEGPYGRLLDAADDHLRLGRVVCFELEALARHRRVLAPVLQYLFHRLEQGFDGQPTLMLLDEAWLYLDEPDFAARIRDWLKTLRKKNVAVVFATQSLSDIAQSSISATLIEACPQRIFLPHAAAEEPMLREVYTRFGLNARQIALLATAVPKRDYYLQSPVGNRLFDLELGPVALALCAAAGPQVEAEIASVLAAAGADGFAAAWLEGHGLDWAADLLRDFDAGKIAPLTRGRRSTAHAAEAAATTGAECETRTDATASAPGRSLSPMQIAD